MLRCRLWLFMYGDSKGSVVIPIDGKGFYLQLLMEKRVILGVISLFTTVWSTSSALQRHRSVINSKKLCNLIPAEPARFRNTRWTSSISIYKLSIILRTRQAVNVACSRVELVLPTPETDDDDDDVNIWIALTCFRYWSSNFIDCTLSSIHCCPRLS